MSADNLVISKKKLKPISANQSQITDASHLVVFCNFSNYDPQQIDDYIALKSETQSFLLNGLENFGNLMTSYAIHKVDACSMEGFEAEKYNEILVLTAKGLNAAVIIPIGYRSKDNTTPSQNA